MSSWHLTSWRNRRIEPASFQTQLWWIMNALYIKFSFLLYLSLPPICFRQRSILQQRDVRKTHLKFNTNTLHKLICEFSRIVRDFGSRLHLTKLEFAYKRVRLKDIWWSHFAKCFQLWIYMEIQQDLLNSSLMWFELYDIALFSSWSFLTRETHTSLILM